MPFVRVLDKEAGPTALGILVPPGRQTLLILRPRELTVDLVATRELGNTELWQMTPEEGSGQAIRLFRALEQPTNVQHHCHWLENEMGWMEFQVESFSLLVCEREPGQPYTPSRFYDPSRGWGGLGLGLALYSLYRVLRPEDHDQEVYFNTVHFETP
jgi:hypothetical protein